MLLFVLADNAGTPRLAGLQLRYGAVARLHWLITEERPGAVVHWWWLGGDAVHGAQHWDFWLVPAVRRVAGPAKILSVGHAMQRDHCQDCEQSCKNEPMLATHAASKHNTALPASGTIGPLHSHMPSSAGPAQSTCRPRALLDRLCTGYWKIWSLGHKLEITCLRSF